MGRVIDLTGQKFNMLTVIKLYDVRPKIGALWICECDCGNKKIISSHALRDGLKSCGCLIHQKKIPEEKKRKGIRLYGIYYGMKQRCYNPNNQGYKWYGSKGISVCDEWLESYENFKKWAQSNGYEETLSIERINPNGNYCPENCCWIPLNDQWKTKGNTVVLDYMGESINLKDLSDITGISRGTLYSRYIKGFNNEEIALSRNKKHMLNGEKYTLSELSDLSGIPRKILASRISRGWTVERSISQPIRKTEPDIIIRFNEEEHTIKEWSEIMKIPKMTLYWRLNKGLSPEQILSKNRNIKENSHD